MKNASIQILACDETVYFDQAPRGELGQRIAVKLGYSGLRDAQARVVIRARGLQCATALSVRPGIHVYPCRAPVLWPGRPPAEDALLIIEAEGAEGPSAARARIPVGHHRPWTVYLLSDTCCDHTWGYTTEVGMIADDLRLTEAEMQTLEATLSDRPENRNRYNFEVADELQFYLEHHDPEDRERLLRYLRQGYFSVSPIPNMALSGAQGIEEMIRQLYRARAWEREHGLPVRFANHQETPTIAWAMASVLAGSGIPYLVKGLLPFDCPWAHRLNEPPIFWWEGPDGQRILYRRYNTHYNEGRFILSELKDVVNHVERRLIPAYEELGGAYPFSAIGLVGCYGDLSPKAAELPPLKADRVAAYNNQGWQYPRLVNASHQLFWEEIQQAVDAGARAPVFRGDYGTSWEGWLPSLVGPFSAWRRLQERGPAADRLAAVAGRLDAGGIETLKELLDEGWRDLIRLADHAWNGAEEPNRRLNLRLRRDWIAGAEAAFGTAIDSSLAAIARAAAHEAGDGALLVFNPLGWRRSGVARLPAPAGAPLTLLSPEGAPAALQRVEEPEGPMLYLRDERLPSLGYALYTRALAPGAPAAPPAAPAPSSRRAEDLTLENRYYRLRLDPRTGAVRSLFSRSLQREMVPRGHPLGLHRWVYRLEGGEQPLEQVRIRRGASGPVFDELLVEARTAAVTVSTSVRLYADEDHIEFSNTVLKAPTRRKEDLHFHFPAAIPRCRYTFEAPGALIRAGELSTGGEQLPGSGQAYTAVRHAAVMHNDEACLTLVQLDSGTVLFGHNTEEEDPVRPDNTSPALIALALGNAVNYAEVTRDQGGEDTFRFRFALRFGPGFDPAASVRFAWEQANPPLAIALQGALPPAAGRPATTRQAARHGFLEIDGASIVLVNLKTAEEHPDDGLIVRLWNLGEAAVESRIRPIGLGAIRSAHATDLLERRGPALRHTPREARLTVPGRGLATALLRLGRPEQRKRSPLTNP